LLLQNSTDLIFLIVRFRIINQQPHNVEQACKPGYYEDDV